MNNYQLKRRGCLRPFLWVIIAVILIALVYVLFFRGKSDKAVHGHPPATAVQTATSSTGNVPIEIEALGTVTANQTITVTSRISGQLMNVHFTEGQWVEKGQLLATVDTRTYQAEKAQYQGDLAENQALLKSARLILARYQRLYAQDSISRQDLDTQAATVAQYEGAVASDAAQIRSAEVDIEYGQITSPVSGYVGLRLTDVGNTVTADDTSIVTITQVEPIAVTFSIPEKNLNQVLPIIRKGGTLPVSVLGADGSTRIAEGKVQYLSNSIDTSTGTIELKAIFPNQDGKLFPNQYVNVVLQTSMLDNTVLVPEAAVQLSDNGDYVYVVDANDVVHKTMITTGPTTTDNNVAVTKGLSAGQQVITRGVDNLTDGAKVKPVQATDSTSDTNTNSSNGKNS